MGDSTGLLIGFFIVTILAVAIGQDAEKRGMSGGLWGVMTFMLAIVAVPMYFLVRKPLPGGSLAGAGFRVCPKCNLANQASDRFCKDCGGPMK